MFCLIVDGLSRVHTAFFQCQRWSLAGRVRLSETIVIGTGFGDLGAAVRLAARGCQVELFEQQDKLGGRAYVCEIDGFTFDGGPTVIASPWIFGETWQAVGRSRQDELQLVRCDPAPATVQVHSPTVSAVSTRKTPAAPGDTPPAGG